MSFSTIIIVGRYRSAAGPASGTVTFTRSALLRDTSTGEVLPPAPVVAHLDSEGVLRVALAATDDPTTLPTGTHYTVAEAAGDCVRTYTITVPYDSPDGVLDLVTVAPGTVPGTVTLGAVTGGSGGGSDPLVLGTSTFTGDHSGQHLSIYGDPADTAAAAVLGSNATGYAQSALEAYGTDQPAIYAQATGSSALYGWSPGNAATILAENDGAGYALQGTGTDAAAVYAANTGAGGAAAIQALSVTGPAFESLGGWLAVPDQSEPATPVSGIVLWSASGVLHAKGPDGVDHALWA